MPALAAKKLRAKGSEIKPEAQAVLYVWLVINEYMLFVCVDEVRIAVISQENITYSNNHLFLCAALHAKLLCLVL